MGVYIDREAVMQKFADHVKRSNNSDFAPVPTWNQAVQIVEDFPAADVRPVVRGHWVDGACSNCGFFTDVVMSRFFSYCPNCGADMREPPKEES